MVNVEQKDIPIELLDRDPLNPRNEIPTDNLIDSLKKVGFKHPIIVRPTDNGGYYVTNGWERVQAAIKIGFSNVPCEIYPDELSAMKVGRAESIVRGWTKYISMIHINNYYRICREQKMSHKKAIERTVSDNDVTSSTVERYIRIWVLPDSVKSLLKQPKKRTPLEWITLLKYNKNIRRYSTPLTVSMADHLVKYGKDIPEWKLLDIATNILGKQVYEAKKIIREACMNHNIKKPIRDIIDSTKTGHIGPVVLHLPSVMISSNEKKLIMNYITERRMRLNDFIRDIIKDFISSLRGD